MTAAGIDDSRMQDYIVGRLSDDERLAFEDRLLNDPALVRDLEHSLALREGLQQLRSQGYFTRATTRVRRLRLWLPALAAASLAGLALFLWGQRETVPSGVLMTSLESGKGATAAASVTTRFTFVSMRGGSTPTLDLPPSGFIEIRAAPSARAPGAHYRVTLMRGDQGSSAQRVGALAALPLSADGYVHCFADASRLSAGNYVLRVERDEHVTNTAGTAEMFTFNLSGDGTRPAE